jgi:fructosamine-3-kinase
MSVDFKRRIESVLDQGAVSASPLSGGSVGEVYKVGLANGQFVVAKVDNQPAPILELEGSMLSYLAQKSQLPVPEVLFCDSRLLLLEYLPGTSFFNSASQQHAAELLTGLHNITAECYGFGYDTLIGGLHQPNPWKSSWIDFFREQRLLFMGQQALEIGRLPEVLFKRLREFSEKLDSWLNGPTRPSLVHGDAWAGNILALNDKITGFLDPAVYFADPEIELAFTTLFGTFGDSFFKRYGEIRPIEPGFIEARRDIYNLYPLLVHVRLFGGSYVSSVEKILKRFGF